jgi:hypothetical protein
METATLFYSGVIKQGKERWNHLYDLEEVNTGAV